MPSLPPLFGQPLVEPLFPPAVAGQAALLARALRLRLPARATEGATAAARPAPGLRALRTIRAGADGSLRIGALATLAEVEAARGVTARFPALVEAVRVCADPLQRRRTSVAALWLGGARPLWTVLQVLDARACVRRRGREIRIPLPEDAAALIAADAAGPRRAPSPPPAVLTGFVIPMVPRGARLGFAVEPAPASDRPGFLAVAALVRVDPRTQRCPLVRIACGGARFFTQRASWAENRLRDDVVSLAAIDEAASSVGEEVPAGEHLEKYRDLAGVVPVLLRRVLLRLLAEGA